MSRLAEQAKALWSAAFFYRRAPHRDQKTAISVIRMLTQSQETRIAQAAQKTMKEIDNERRHKD